MARFLSKEEKEIVALRQKAFLSLVISGVVKVQKLYYLMTLKKNK